MKKTMIALAIAAIFIACNSKPGTETDTANTVVQADTMNIEHNSFTDKAVDINMTGVNDTIVGRNGVQYVKVNPNGPVTNNVAHYPPATRRPTFHTSVQNTSGGSGSGNSVSTGSTSESSTGTESSTPTVVKKKGWSNTLKGTVIGAGTGAVAGALIDKKKGRGAIIGGVLGAGGGFVVGKVLDKKAEKNQ